MAQEMTFQEHVARMRRDLQETGTCRAEDYIAVLGDPSQGVSISACASSEAWEKSRRAWMDDVLPSVKK